ncbi:MAG: hypothetical protein ABJE10_05430 [bacterium]
MTQSFDASNTDNRDLTRVTQEITGRLRARGVDVFDSDSPDDVVRMLEALETFERSVEMHGGDLMMDEPPTRQAAQPDDPQFLLPKRSADESATAFMQRLAAATSAIRKHKPHT